MKRRTLLAAALGLATAGTAGCALSRAPGEVAARPRSLEPAPPSDPWDAVRQHWSDADLELYPGPVDHIFFHQMIPFPELAFAARDANNFDDWYLTKSETVKIIHQLHERGFILVDINDVFVDRDGTMGRNPELRVPKGRKPLILSIDDKSFNRFLLGKGFMDKLIVDDEGRLNSVGTDPATRERVISRENTTPTYLDDFLIANPDFSLNGATGTLAVTGYEGILGYRTDLDDPNHVAEIEAARPVITALRDHGWTFACHSYGHIDLSKQSTKSVARDTDKWLKEVGSLVGETKVYITPFGSTNSRTGPVMQVLHDRGFRTICTVGSTTETTAVRQRKAIYQTRVHVDGVAMRRTPEILDKFFDVSAVFDREVRPRR